MHPLVVAGLIISAIYLLFNNEEEEKKEETKNETILAHDVSSRRRVRRTRLERSGKPNGARPNRTSIATTYTDMNDEIVNDNPKEEHANE